VSPAAQRAAGEERAVVAENLLDAGLRAATGKGVARKLRAVGRIPGVLYGKGRESRSIALDPRALERVLHKSGAGMNTLIDLDIEGSQQVVLVKELQRDPVSGHYLHADLYLVDLTQKIEVAVPLHFVGKAAGIELGGILDHPLREIEVECLPRAIPDQIEVDVASLNVGDSLHVRDLVLPPGVTVKTDLDLPVASVVLPAAEEVAEVVEVAAVPGEGEAAPATEAEGESESED
jgi:large subunit ribosomal protein L25